MTEQQRRPVRWELTIRGPDRAEFSIACRDRADLIQALRYISIFLRMSFLPPPAPPPIQPAPLGVCKLHNQIWQEHSDSRKVWHPLGRGRHIEYLSKREGAS